MADMGKRKFACILSSQSAKDEGKNWHILMDISSYSPILRSVMMLCSDANSPHIHSSSPLGFPGIACWSGDPRPFWLVCDNNQHMSIRCWLEQIV